MQNSAGVYNLKGNQPRRAGLTRAGHRGPSLLQTINASNKKFAITMPPRSKAVVDLRATKEEDVTAPPLSSDSDESADEREKSTNMQASLFKRASEGPSPVLKSKSGSTIGGIARGPSHNSNKTTDTHRTKSTKSIKSSRKGVSPNSSVSSSSPKRKSQGEAPVELGKEMEDTLFGVTKNKKKKISKYGSSQPPYRSSQSLGASKIISKKMDQGEFCPGYLAT